MLLSSYQLPTDQSSIKGYLCEIFEYLTTIQASSSSHLTFTSFHKFLNFPLIVSQKIFNVLDIKHTEKLTREQFVNGLYDIYFGTLDQKFDLLFSFLDFSQAGYIHKDDAHLILSHLSMVECILTIPIIEEIINEVYGEETTLTKELFAFKSNLFFLVNYFISRFKPFHEESIQYYRDNHLNRWYEKIESDKEKEKEKVSDYKKKSKFFFSQNVVPLLNHSSPISDPSGTLLKYINGINNYVEDESEILLKEIDCLEKFEEDKTSFLIIENSLDFKSFSNGQNKPIFQKTLKKNVRSLNSSNAEKCSDSNTSITRETSANNSGSFLQEPCPTPKIDSKRRNSDASDSDLSGNSSSSKNEIKEILALSLYKDELRTMKLVLVSKDIFCLKLTRDKKVFKLFKIISLRCSLILEGEPTKYKNNTYYPIQVMEILGGKSSKTMDFLGEDQKEMHKFVSICKEAAGHRKLLKAYEVKEDIGKGQFGKVKLGISKSNGEKVAIKVLKKSAITTKKDLEMVHWEIAIFNFLKRAHHPGIIKSLDYFESAISYYFVYEYCSGGNLTKHLYSKCEYLSITELKSFACQIGDAIDFLHRYGIIHRDIKPDNILVQKYSDHSVQLKLIDFGLSKVMGMNESTTESYGSLCYTCPEILSNVPYNHKADVWSFGILLYYLRFGILPFDDAGDLGNIMKKIIIGSFVYPADSGKSHNDSDLAKVIHKCLQPSPMKRKTVREIMKSKWFKSI